MYIYIYTYSVLISIVYMYDIMCCFYIVDIIYMMYVDLKKKTLMKFIVRHVQTPTDHFPDWLQCVVRQLQILAQDE